MNDGSDLVGRTLLVGITYVDGDGAVLERQQMHGVIEAADDAIVLRKPDGEIVTLPPQVDPAEPGEYQLATGEVVVDPDYVATWTVAAPGSDDDRG